MLIRVVKFLRGSRGASVPFVAVVLTLLLITAGVVIDLGHLYVVRQELKNAADAGALAGARGLFVLTDPSDPQPANIHCDLAHAAGLATVKLNTSDSQNLNIPDGDVKVGIWEYTGGVWQFREAACCNEINAVQVTTRRTSAVNGAVNLFFAKLLGKDTAELNALATAMLGWCTSLPPGFAFPLALSNKYVPKDPGQRIPVTFSPDWGDSGGWHCFETTSADANDLKRYINGTTPTPAIELGDWITCLNGVAESVVMETKAVKTVEQQLSQNGKWIVYLPVIDTTKMTQSREVLGFCAFEIQSVDTSSKSVSGDALGMYLAPGTTQSPTPGGNNSLRSQVPKLVQ